MQAFIDWFLSLFGVSNMPVFEKQANTPVFEKQEESMSSVDIANYLREKLPNMHAQYADAYAQAALNHQTIYLKPIEFALLHAGVIDRESKAGALLRPRGSGGTGDPTPRWYTSGREPPWASELNLFTGNVRSGYDENREDGFREEDTQVEVRPPAYAGASVAGWGYGLGQIDFASNREWLDANNWKDPYINLDKSAGILSDGIERFGDIRLGVVAYNAGYNHAYGSGDPDRYTTGKNYSKDVISRANAFGFDKLRVV